MKNMFFFVCILFVTDRFLQKMGSKVNVEKKTEVSSVSSVDSSVVNEREVDWREEKDKNTAKCEILCTKELPFIEFDYGDPQLTWDETTRVLSVWNWREMKKLGIQVNEAFTDLKSDPEWKEIKDYWHEKNPFNLRNHWIRKNVSFHLSGNTDYFLTIKNKQWVMFDGPSLSLYTLKNYCEANWSHESRPKWMTPDLLVLRGFYQPPRLVTPQFKVVWNMENAPYFNALLPLTKNIYAICYTDTKTWHQVPYSDEDVPMGQDVVEISLICPQRK
jgi:hypothetical protein